MFQHNEKKHMPYSADLLFGLVMDIEAYPQFLPWCNAARIKSHEGNVVIADLIVGTNFVSEKFTSQVTYDKKNYKIATEYIEGPLEYMHSHWQFLDCQTDNCQLEFSVEFAFRKGILEKIFQPLFQKATLRMIEAFEIRAKQQEHNNA